MDQRLLQSTGLWLAVVAVAIAVLFNLVDKPVDIAAHTLHGGTLYKAGQSISLLADHSLFNVLLFFGYFIGGIAALWRGFDSWVKNLLYCCLTVTIAMLIGETLKWFFGRYRPVMFFEQGLYGFSWFADKGKMHSFPSGHNMRIFSLMTALSFVWPKARIPLIGLACIVGASRVLVTRHYPSDVVAGAFVGIIVAAWAWRIMQGKGRDG